MENLIIYTTIAFCLGVMFWPVKQQPKAKERDTTIQFIGGRLWEVEK